MVLNEQFTVAEKLEINWTKWTSRMRERELTYNRFILVCRSFLFTCLVDLMDDCRNSSS